MKYVFLRSLYIVFCLQSILLYGHGFGPTTLVKIANGSWRQIEEICQNSIKNKMQIISYDLNASVCSARQVKYAGTSSANCSIKIGFDYSGHDDIICTPEQEFYMPNAKQWVCAYKLRIGDMLLSEGNVCKQITCMQWIKEPIQVYIVEVEDTHNFLVGHYSILTHNMILPYAFNIGISVPFGSVAAGSAGSFFGPIACVGGAVLGGLIGIISKIFHSDRIQKYRLLDYDISMFDTHGNDQRQFVSNNDAQAPGKPTVDDGYTPPKNWDGKKVKHSKNGKVGWPDVDGNVWVPTGPGSSAHGGPHWDVQHSNGKTYDNIYPGGKIRLGKGNNIDE